jgi:hypothetical protein
MLIDEVGVGMRAGRTLEMLAERETWVIGL